MLFCGLMQSTNLFYRINEKLSHNYVSIYVSVFVLGLISFLSAVSFNHPAYVTIEPLSPISWITAGVFNTTWLPIINGALLLFGLWLFFRSLLKRLSFLALFLTLFTLAASPFLYSFMFFDFSFNILFVALSIFLFFFFKLDEKIKTPFTPPRKVVKYWLYYILALVVLLLSHIVYGWVAIISLLIYFILTKRWLSVAISVPLLGFAWLITLILSNFFAFDLNVYSVSFQPISVMVDGVTNFYFFSTLNLLTAKYIVFAFMVLLFVFQLFLLAIRNRAFLFVWIFIIVSFVIFTLFTVNNSLDDRYLYILLPYINSMFMITICQLAFRRNWATIAAVVSGVLFTVISLLVNVLGNWC